MPAMTNPIHRIQSLDQIRGLSLMGILVVNYMAFSLPLDAYMFPSVSPLIFTGSDHASWWVIKTFFQEKFISLFSMLFGISMGLVAKGSDGHSVLKRRLISLLFIGVAHGALIWGGDVLFLYAVCGLIMMMWLNLSARQLITGGIVLFLIGAVIISGLGILAQFAQADLGISQDSIRAVISDYRGPFAQSLRANFDDWIYAAMAMPVYIPTTLGLMRLGLGLFRIGFFDPESHKSLRLGLLALMPLGLIISGYQAFQIIKTGYDPLRIIGDLGLFGHVLAPIIALGYASIIIMMGKAWLNQILGSYGRMAFSHYLMQSILMTMIFYGGDFRASLNRFGHLLTRLGWVNRPLAMSGRWPLG